MSSIDYYAGMLEDRRRIRWFGGAIRSAVRRGDRVVEIGCGLGTYAVLAARAGAARVDAIDSNAQAIAFARELGVEREGVRLVEGDAERVKLGGRADVVIFEDFSGFGFFPGIRRLLQHVHARMAAKRARYVPQAVDLWLAPVTDRIGAAFKNPAELPFDPGRFALFRRRLHSEMLSRKLEARRLAGPGVRVGGFALDRDLPERVVFEARLRCSRTAKVTGLGGWTAMTMPGLKPIVNAPGRAESAWSSAFFPFEAALPCRRGESIDVSVEAAFGPGPKGLIWRWRASGRSGSREGCSVNAMPGDLELLRRGSPDYVPRPGERRDFLVEVCRAVDGRRSVREIAKRIGAGEEEAQAAVDALRGWGVK